MLCKRINAGIPGCISWQDQEVSVLQGKVDIDGLALLDPDGRSVLTAAHVSLNAGVLDFLAGSLRIQSAHVAAPRVFLRTTEPGGLNLIRVFSAAAAKSRRPAPERGEAARGPGIALQIQKLRVSRGHFSYAASPGSGAGRIHMADVELLLEDADIGQRSGHLEMSAKGGQVPMAGCDRPVDHFHLEAALNKGRIAPLEMDLVSGSSRLHLSGSAAGIFADPQPESGPNPELDLGLSVSTELCELREIFGWQTALAGPVTLQIKARGPMRNPEVSVRAACGPGRVGD
ncbi:MAG TPA: hypothetical protein VKO20_02255, partial [Desulfosalsimonadaceae bacterium]|nr:hypothetical protein [Desulfosalsimonadaceae bacterium]